MRCFDVTITAPIEGGYFKELIKVPIEGYSELMGVGGVGAKIRVTMTRSRTVLEREDFILCRRCGDMLLYDEDLLSAGVGNILK